MSGAQRSAPTGSSSGHPRAQRAGSAASEAGMMQRTRPAHRTVALVSARGDSGAEVLSFRALQQQQSQTGGREPRPGAAPPPSLASQHRRRLLAPRSPPVPLSRLLLRGGANAALGTVLAAPGGALRKVLRASMRSALSTCILCAASVSGSRTDTLLRLCVLGTASAHTLPGTTTRTQRQSLQGLHVAGFTEISPFPEGPWDRCLFHTIDPCEI
ncbi:hypothetical protein NDU88_007794 [Pleurodeles waltl]|uniref:Uncharacterized protein n=1 Tax=Pleurodeles waltl TaxID=8319 RepID=A0AAV7RW42_PLEWA|nr:hypothetical protein NDU88_007794 [Pleurodeles waltl]